MSGNAAICCEKCNVPMLSQHGAYHSQNGQIVCPRGFINNNSTYIKRKNGHKIKLSINLIN